MRTAYFTARRPDLDASRRDRLAENRYLAALGACLMVAVLLAIGCGGSSSPTSPIGDPNPGGEGDCPGPYPDWQTSDYNLPWQIGEAYLVIKANCVPGHRDRFKYSYDIRMPIGTVVTAIRGGQVIQVIMGGEDFDVNGTTNNIEILHPDGTVGRYNHLTQRGGLVSQFDFVNQGDPIGLSGASGVDNEHLHFHVEMTEGGQSIPLTFRNTQPNPGGLVRGTVYVAQASGGQQGAPQRLDAVATPPGNNPPPDVQAPPRPARERTFEPNPD